MPASKRRRWRIAIAQVVLQQDTSLVPVALSGALRGPEHTGDLREGKATEKFQVDDLCQARLDLAKRLERLADALQLRLIRCERGRLGPQGRDLEAAAALLCAATAHVVDDQPAHGARGIGQKAHA